MLDEQDIEMLARLLSQQKEDIISEVGVVVDSKIKDSEQRMITTMDSKVRESERRMMVMMESYFDPKFQALSERLDDIEKKLIPQEAMDIMEDRVDDLEKTVAIHTRQIEELKKDFVAVEEQVSLFEKVDTEGVEPMVYPFEAPTTFLREDVVSDVLTQEEALKNVKDARMGHVHVPKVVK